MRKKIVAGNWKMNTLLGEGVELSKGVAAGLAAVPSDVKLVIAPPFTHLYAVADAIKGTSVSLGAQNCVDQKSGAYTGEVSAAMLRSVNCEFVILGHSERREYYGENNDTLNRKMQLALENGLSPIFCVGEKLEEREAGRHFDVVGEQLRSVLFNLTAEQMASVVVAYEPVWAIGTGKTATASQAQEIHAFIRKTLREKFGALADEISILYGGSCKPSNAGELFSQPDIDGGLIGGASLKAGDFLEIAKSY